MKDEHATGMLTLFPRSDRSTPQHRNPVHHHYDLKDLPHLTISSITTMLCSHDGLCECVGSSGVSHGRAGNVGSGLQGGGRAMRSGARGLVRTVSNISSPLGDDEDVVPGHVPIYTRYCFGNIENNLKLY